MSDTTPHIPVLLDEVLEALEPRDGGFYVDMTFGAGGHSRAILEAAGPGSQLLAFDRDPSALVLAMDRLGELGSRVTVANENYSELGSVLDQERFGHLVDGTYRVDGILLDAGVSSMQLDQGERGFSWREDAPLDMRMDPTRGLSAGEWLDTHESGDLHRVLREYGEMRGAHHVARKIVEARRSGELSTTKELAELCEEIIHVSPKKKRRIHPATLVFQALRIEVNDELTSLGEAVAQIPGRLVAGGSAAVISFHSLEDRIVKRAFRDATKRDVPRHLPVLGDGGTEFSLPRGLVTPSDEELERNPRARSSRMRTIRRQAR